MPPYNAGFVRSYIVISLRHLTLARAAKILVDDANLQIHPGQKIGLTGANGSGKSSLFALLLGELHAEAGELFIPPAWTVAHVSQETPALPQPALEFALDGDKQLRSIERALDKATEDNEGVAVGELHARLSEIDGYSARARAAELLHGLGFSDADFDKPVAAFSGGWRVRLNLAQALMSRSDLLLLDEPTNHLDLDAVLWLESWLKSYPGTLLLISHDRDFLDEVTTHILHIENRVLKLYTGGYSDFERQRAAQLAVQQAMYEKQQRERAHLESFVERFRAKATKARQAQSRIKALARMEDIAAAHVDSPFSFRFPEPGRAPEVLIDLRDADAGYGPTPILRRVSLALRPGERIGLLGRNGAGKSTLVKLLAGALAPLSGKRSEGKGLNIGYFAQHQLEQLRPDESPLQHLLRLSPQTREQDLRVFLGTFDFRGDMALAPCGPFSGGEKSRLALALLIWQRPNLLLLDEPTNHLDMEMRHALNLALQEFEGAVVLVSHDRSLLRATCDRFLLVAESKAVDFDGDLEDYRTWLNQQRAQQNAGEANPEKAARREQRENNQAERQALLARRRPLLKELENLEKKLAQWHEEKNAIDAQLGASSLYDPNQRENLEIALKRQAHLASTIEAAEERWLTISTALEDMKAI